MTIGTLWIYRLGLMMADQRYAMTLAFTTFVLFQFFNVFNAREEFGSVFNNNFFKNYRLWVSLMTVLVLQLVVIYWAPAQELFKTESIEPKHWPFILLISSSVLFLEELRKILFAKKRKIRGRA